MKGEIEYRAKKSLNYYSVFKHNKRYLFFLVQHPIKKFKFVLDT